MRKCIMEFVALGALVVGLTLCVSQIYAAQCGCDGTCNITACSNRTMCDEAGVFTPTGFTAGAPGMGDGELDSGSPCGYTWNGLGCWTATTNVCGGTVISSTWCTL